MLLAVAVSTKCVRPAVFGTHRSPPCSPSSAIFPIPTAVGDQVLEKTESAHTHTFTTRRWALLLQLKRISGKKTRRHGVSYANACSSGSGKIGYKIPYTNLQRHTWTNASPARWQSLLLNLLPSGACTCTCRYGALDRRSQPFTPGTSSQPIGVHAPPCGRSHVLRGGRTVKR